MRPSQLREVPRARPDQERYCSRCGRSRRGDEWIVPVAALMGAIAGAAVYRQWLILHWGAVARLMVG